MKTNLFFRRFVILIALILCIVITSCTKEESLEATDSEIPATSILKNAQISENDMMICDLIAGQDMVVGRVIYSNDGENLFVDYFADNGWTLSEVHLFVGQFEDLPRNKTAIQIGHFPYSATELNGVTHYSFTIPLAELEKDEQGYLIAAHAVVENGDQQETGWANCTYHPQIITVKCLVKKTEGEPPWLWAVSEGEPFRTMADGEWAWCNNLGIINFEGENLYGLKELFGPHGTVGTIDIQPSGNLLSIDVSVIGELGLWDTYVYVGSMAGLVATVDGTDGPCPNFNNFPYQMHTHDALTSLHSFSIPIPAEDSESVSFKDAFGSNRWGWFGYYNF